VVPDDPGTTAADSITIALYGDIDLYTLPQMRNRVEAALDSGVHVLGLNLAGVSFIDSVGLALLVKTHRQLQNRGGKLVVNAASPPVRRLLEITGLAPLFGMDEPGLPGGDKAAQQASST
jgi:anti-sigma B factor antagonist